MKSSFFKWILIIFIFLLVLLLTRYRKTYEFLFENPFGAVALVCIVGFALYINTRLGIYFGFIIGLFFLLAKILQEFGGFGGFGRFGGKKEGFTSGEKNYWSQDTIDAFLHINSSLYEKMFDIDIVQCQATEEEVKEFLKTNLWPWSDETKQQYGNVLKKNTMLKTDTFFTMQDAMSTYNNNAMMQLLEWNSPEGKLLLQGRYIPGTARIYGGNGTYGLNSGLETVNQDIIRCGTNGKMVRYHNVDNDGITGAHVQKVTEVDYRELPKLLPGFSWKGEPCNPCKNLENPPEIKCKFSITPPKNIHVVETHEETSPWTVSWV